MNAVVHKHRCVRSWYHNVLRPGIVVIMAWVIALACGSPEPRPASAPVIEATPALEETTATDGGQEEQAAADDGHQVGGLETYIYWAGQEPDADMKVLNGEYWSSAHWTKEYTLYLELRFPRAKEFVMGKSFKRAEQWQALQDAPDWFHPPTYYELWEGELGSRYYLHPKTGHIYIYEVKF